MAVEIGTLVLRGSFGPARSEPERAPLDIEADLDALRRDILRDVEEMLEQADRRNRER